jgi:tetratricopeptide (TPR) repeat protein
VTGTFLRTLVLCLPVHLSAQPADPATLRQYFQEGEKALADRRYGDAEKAYSKLRALSPETAEVYGRLGLVYFQQRKYEEAIPTLRQGLKLKPSLPNADILLAMSLSELGRYTEALPGLTKGFRRSADPALKRMSGLQLQRSFTGLRQDDKAVEIALELNRLYPNDPEILYHGARLFGNFAFVNMRKLAEVAPKSVWRYQAAGEVHEGQGNYELAIAAYRQVLEVDPRHVGMHFRIGRVQLLRSWQPDSPPDLITLAAREFEQELHLDPTNANAAYELGEIHRRAGKLDNARESFEFALKSYPDFEEAHVALGRVLLASGKPEAAANHLRRAVELNANNAVSYFHLAQVYRVLGKPTDQQKALAEFRRIQGQKRTEEITTDLFSRQVTKQELETGAVP